MEAIRTFWKPYIYEVLLRHFPIALALREKKQFEKKCSEIVACTDNAKIPRHKDAGKIVDNVQIMHNGLKVSLDCYSSEINRGIMTSLFQVNKGVHEPSEEYAFQTLLENIKDGSTIVELGSWWAFYSMWFCTKVRNYKAYLVEAEAPRLDAGRKNFELNGLVGDFSQYFVGETSGTWNETKRSLMKGTYQVETSLPQICVDDFVKLKKISFIHILHADIQGAEVEMLRGAKETFAADKIGYVCISTHSDQLHRECLDILKDYNFKILCDVDVTHCAHTDGFIVGRASSFAGPDKIEIDVKRNP